MNRGVLLVVVGALMLPLISATDTSEQQEAMKRIEQAVAKTNIFDLPSFQMKASVQIDSQGKPLDGNYQLFWNGPDQWREELSFPGYTELQVGGKGTVWIQRSMDFIPLRINELHAALGFGSGVAGSASGRFWSLVQPDLTSRDTIKKIHSRKEHRDELTCAEIEDERKHSSEICVNDSTGTLFRGSSYQDKDFQPVGGKYILDFLASWITVRR